MSAPQAQQQPLPLLASALVGDYCPAHHPAWSAAQDSLVVKWIKQWLPELGPQATSSGEHSSQVSLPQLEASLHHPPALQRLTGLSFTLDKKTLLHLLPVDPFAPWPALSPWTPSSLLLPSFNCGTSQRKKCRLVSSHELQITIFLRTFICFKVKVTYHQ